MGELAQAVIEEKPVEELLSETVEQSELDESEHSEEHRQDLRLESIKEQTSEPSMDEVVQSEPVPEPYEFVPQNPNHGIDENQDIEKETAQGADWSTPAPVELEDRALLDAVFAALPAQERVVEKQDEDIGSPDLSQRTSSANQHDNVSDEEYMCNQFDTYMFIMR